MRLSRLEISGFKSFPDRDYLALDAARFPHLTSLAPHLYRGAGEDFAFAVRLLVEALARRGTR